MTTQQFITLVSDMRKAQKEYFRTRSKIVLEESKRLERAILKAFREQQKIFWFKTEGHSTGYRLTDHHTYCKELGLS